MPDLDYTRWTVNIVITYLIIFLLIYTDWKKESITEPRPTMEISVEDLLDIGTGK